MVAFCQAAGIPIRGHTLIWNEWNPEWLKQAAPGHVAYWLDRHIEEVVGRYAGKFHSWDVVNEPMWPGHNKEFGLRSGQADCADEQAIAVFLMREDMLDAGADR